MYDDPTHIKDVRINIRVNQHQYERIKRVASFLETQNSTYARDKLIKALENDERLIGIHDNSVGQALEDTYR